MHETPSNWSILCGSFNASKSSMVLFLRMSHEFRASNGWVAESISSATTARNRCWSLAVLEYKVWRCRNPWDCTIAELAQLPGLSLQKVCQSFKLRVSTRVNLLHPIYLEKKWGLCCPGGEIQGPNPCCNMWRPGHHIWPQAGTWWPGDLVTCWCMWKIVK